MTKFHIAPFAFLMFALGTSVAGANLPGNSSSKVDSSAQSSADRSPDSIIQTLRKEFSQNLKFTAFGDMRLRHETLAKESTPDRNRQRMRLRAGIKANISEDMKVGFRVATGGSSITSANQDLGGSFSKKSFGVDQAYIAYQFTKTTKFIGGKMKNTFYRPLKSEMVWDSDVNPEGFVFLNKQKLGNNMKLSAQAGAFVMEERKTESNSMLYGGQLQLETKINLLDKVNVGTGFFAFTNVQGFAPLFNSDGNGNTLNGDGTANDPFLLTHQYQVAQAFASYQTSLWGSKLTLGADGIINTAISKKNLGATVGFKLGDRKSTTPLVFGYKFHYLERDATLAVITGSDTFDGDTNGKAHHITGEYYISPKASIGTQVFISKLDLDSSKIDFTRAMADFKVSF